MKFPVVLGCAVLAALMVSTDAGVIVSPKASLSLKDKLVLELPVKQLVVDKAGEKHDSVKVGFSTTTTTTSTTTENPKAQRPKYVDAAVFRHQFTTPPPSPAAPSPVETFTSEASSTSSSSSSTSTSFSTSFSDGSSLRTREEVVGDHADRELGLVTDRKTESFRRGFRPASSGSLVVDPVSTTTTKRPTTTSSFVEETEEAAKDAESHDYEAHFRLLDDLSPFGGELGVLGGDRRGAGYIGSFRPLGF